MAGPYDPMGTGVLSAAERHPLLTGTGRRVLTDLVESPTSPPWNHHCGDRLDAAGRRRVEAFATLVTLEQSRWPAGGRPDWVGAFVEHATRTVPRYRAAGAALDPGFTTSRHDLGQAWWELVPDDVAADELIWFPTSGTGGPPVVVPTHPVTTSCYYPLLLEAARRHGVSVRFRSGRADWVTVFSQTRGGFVVPSWSSVLGCATAKVNLAPEGWRAAGDRERFLAQHDPQVITGDPVSLAHLADLDVALTPAVLISTALHLAPATRRRLEERFACPVVDVYSLTESGPVAASRPGGDGMALLSPRLFVEVVDGDGAPCPPGVPGEVALTGGMNPYLPLLRYRTGDGAALEWRGDLPVLVGLSGRATVMLRAAAGTPANSIDVTQAFERLPLRRWSVHQRADASVVVAAEAEAGAGDGLDAAVAAALTAVLGPVPVSVVPLDTPDKVVPFTVDEGDAGDAGAGAAGAGEAGAGEAGAGEAGPWDAGAGEAR